MVKEEELQQQYMQMQMLQQQMEEVNQYLQVLMQQNADLDVSIEAVQQLGQAKVNNALLAPIANGIFIKSELKDNQTLIVNVGTDVTVEKTVPEVVKLLNQQKQKLSQEIYGMDNLLQDLNQQMMQIYEQVQN